MTHAKIEQTPKETVPSLPIGTTLSGDQFTITEHLGAGGFGITYRARDNVLGRTVVIKECYYEDFCARSGKSVVARSQSYAKPIRSIVKMFMREAQSLAKIRHPNIVGVHRAFEENDTAYMVLDLIEGPDLFDIIADPVSPARVQDILTQLLDAIEKVHELDLLHRDISPDNILIEHTGTPVLIDFGAARAEASRHTRAISSLLVVKDGYSPHEFYVTGSDQTPSSDLYALAATFYHVLTGQAPPNSQSRMVEIAGRRPDPCVPLAGRVKGYDDTFLQAIDTAMQIHPSDRIQTAAKWKSLIAEGKADTLPTGQPRVSSKDVSLDLERSLTRLVEETNDEVRRISQQPEEPEKVVSFPEPSKKPEWIDEFNLESRAPKPSPIRDPVVVRAPIDTVEPPAPDPSTIELPPAASETFGPEFKGSQVNWAVRALEKQERIKSERESQIDIPDEDAESVSAAQAAKYPFQTAEQLKEQEAAVTAARTQRSMRLVAGLLMCFSLVFFFAVP
ncbi:MAG: serine/threonine protein kinase [Boseongicola sp.]|nr:serine/threonine protein kinase [Boseongicola sp.]